MPFICHNLAFLFIFFLVGCGGYASTSEAFRHSLATGNLEQAEKDVNKALDVDSVEELPSKKKNDTPLLLLERGTILQAQGEYALSARDFETADQQLEILDLTHDTLGAIGKYVFSGSAEVYKTPAYEKLLIATLNMLNYLALGDLQNAKVEARRFTISRSYYRSIGDNENQILAFGSYLAGFTFEKAGDASEAMRHYADAYEAGGLSGLSTVIRRLHQNKNVTDERISKVLTGSSDPVPKDCGELLLIFQDGIVPYKQAVREPIGAAIALATAPGPSVKLSPEEQRQAQHYALQGMLKWVNYPQLTRVSLQSAPPFFAIDHKKTSINKALDIEERAIEYDNAQSGTIITAAITRMITRAIANEATQAITQTATKSKNNSASLLGFLLGMSVEGAMIAADTPDTRSWVTLPARIYFLRTALPQGDHVIQLSRGSRSMEYTFSVQPGGFTVVNFSALR